MGIDSPRTSNTTDLKGIANIRSMQNKYVYNWIKWGTSMTGETGGAVALVRGMYPADATNTTGVVSTLTYGVQWDATMNWMSNIDNPNVSGAKYITNSMNMGNYYNTAIATNEFNAGSRYSVYTGSEPEYISEYKDVDDSTVKGNTNTNTPADKWLLTTGAIDKAKVNNIYDMAGNVYEWTMEGFSANDRAMRGGNFKNSGSDYPASSRSNNYPGSSNFTYGARPSLYIK